MSAPISGTEHVISHVLDMISDHYNRGLALHCVQVGVTTLTVAQLYQHFLDKFDHQAVNIDACYTNDEELKVHIRQIFLAIDPSGAMAHECWSDYSKKLALWRRNRERFEQFCKAWNSTHRPKLASLVCPQHVVYNILSKVGAPITCQELEPPISKEEYDFAVHNGHFIRARFVLGDLLYFLGWRI